MILFDKIFYSFDVLFGASQMFYKYIWKFSSDITKYMFFVHIHTSVKGHINKSEKMRGFQVNK